MTQLMISSPCSSSSQCGWLSHPVSQEWHWKWKEQEQLQSDVLWNEKIKWWRGVQIVVCNVWLFVSFSYYVCDGGSGASCRVPAWRRSDRLLRGSQNQHQHWAKWSTLCGQLVRSVLHQSVCNFIPVYERITYTFTTFWVHFTKKRKSPYQFIHFFPAFDRIYQFLKTFNQK